MISSAQSLLQAGLLHPQTALSQWRSSHLPSLTSMASPFPIENYFPGNLSTQKQHRSEPGVKQPGGHWGPMCRLLDGAMGSVLQSQPCSGVFTSPPRFFASSLGQCLFLNTGPCSLLGFISATVS